MITQVLQTLAGIVTGYTTNWIAVRMIFRKYGPFGGVVLKTREEFIRNVSLMVEEEIVRTPLLVEKLNSPEAKRVGQEMVSSFLLQDIPALLENGPQSSTPGGEALRHALSLSLANSARRYLARLTLGEVFGPEQREVIRLQWRVKGVGFLQRQEAWHQCCRIPLAGLIPEDILKAFGELLRQDFPLIEQELQREAGKGLLRLIRSSEFDAALKEILERGRMESPLGCLSAPGEALLKELLVIRLPGNQLMVHRESLAKRLSPSVQEAYTRYVEESAGLLAREKSRVIAENKEALEERIRLSIGEALQDEEAGIASRLVLSLFTSSGFLSSLGIPERMDRYGDRILLRWAEKLKGKGLLSLFPLLPDQLSIPLLPEKGDLWDWIQRSQAEIRRIPAQPAGEMLAFMIPNLFLKGEVLASIPEKFLKAPPTVSLGDILGRLDLSELPPDLLERLSESSIGEIGQWKEEEILCWLENQMTVFSENFSGENIRKLLESLGANPEQQRVFYENFLHFLNQNMELLIDGAVKEQVAGNLRKLTDQEIQQVLEDYMGRELRPIATFGAFLGGLAGIGYGALLAAGALGSGLYGQVILYAVVGYVTNVVAIQMIFRPYEQKRLLGIPLPFTPGVITREKERMAESLGNFIEGHLLGHDEMEDWFASHEKEVETMISSYLMSHKTIERLLRLYRSTLTIQITEGIVKFLDKQGTQIGQKAGEIILSATPQWEPGKEKELLQALLPEFLVKEIPSLIVAGFFSDKILAKNRDSSLALSFNLRKNLPALLAVLQEKMTEPEVGQWLSLKIKEQLKQHIRGKLAGKEAKSLLTQILVIIQNKEDLFYRRMLEELEKNTAFVMVATLLPLRPLLRKTTGIFMRRHLPGFFAEKEPRLIREMEDLFLVLSGSMLEEALDRADISTLFPLGNSEFRELEQVIGNMLDNLEKRTWGEFLADSCLPMPPVYSQERLEKVVRGELALLFEKTDALLTKEQTDAYQKLAISGATYSVRRILAHIDDSALTKMGREGFAFFQKELLDHKLLEKDLQDLIKTLAHSEKNKERNIPILRNEVEEAVDNVRKTFAGLEESEKQHILSYPIKASLSTLHRHLAAIFKVLDVKEMTTSRVQQMDPEKIERVFYSFAGPYLKKIAIYGLFGGLFGGLTGILLKFLGF